MRLMLHLAQHNLQQSNHVLYTIAVSCRRALHIPRLKEVKNAMEEVEMIKVYVDIKKGHTVCICPRAAKSCGKRCAKDVVARDKFADWEKIMKRDRYGKSKV